MAALLPKYQNYYDTGKGFIVGIHKLILVSTSDTLTVPRLAHSTSGNSVAQVRDAGESAVTVSTSDAFTVTLVSGTVGDEVTVLTTHKHINHGAEA